MGHFRRLDGRVGGQYPPTLSMAREIKALRLVNQIRRAIRISRRILVFIALDQAVGQLLVQGRFVARSRA